VNTNLRSQQVEIGKSHSTVEMPVSLDEIRKRADRLAAKMRNEARIRHTAIYVWALSGISGTFLIGTPHFAWFLLVQLASIMVWASQLPGVGAASRRAYTLSTSDWVQALNLDSTAISKSASGLDFYQKNLELRRANLRPGLIATPIMGLLGLVITLLPMLYVSKRPWLELPMGISIMIFGIASYIHIRRELPTVQRELDELHVSNRTQTNNLQGGAPIGHP
jgi:amino acid transporter